MRPTPPKPSSREFRDCSGRVDWFAIDKVIHHNRIEAGSFIRSQGCVPTHDAHETTALSKSTPRNESPSLPTLYRDKEVPSELLALSKKVRLVALARSTSVNTAPKPLVSAAVLVPGEEIYVYQVAADRSEESLRW
jgi:hypothetical protein